MWKTAPGLGISKRTPRQHAIPEATADEGRGVDDKESENDEDGHNSELPSPAAFGRK